MRDEVQMLDLLRELIKQMKNVNEKLCCVEDLLKQVVTNTA